MTVLPLLDAGPRLALVSRYRVQHHLGRVGRRVALEALAPVVADGVGKDGSGLVKRRRRDASSDVGVALEPVLGILVPEVEGTVATRRAEGSVLRVERDVVDRVDVGDASLGGVAMALERKIGASSRVSLSLSLSSSLSLSLPLSSGHGKNDGSVAVPTMLTWNPYPRRIGWRSGPQCCQWQNRRNPRSS